MSYCALRTLTAGGRYRLTTDKSLHWKTTNKKKRVHERNIEENLPESGPRGGQLDIACSPLQGSIRWHYRKFNLNFVHLSKATMVTMLPGGKYSHTTVKRLCKEINHIGINLRVFKTRKFKNVLVGTLLFELCTNHGNGKLRLHSFIWTLLSTVSYILWDGIFSLPYFGRGSNFTRLNRLYI